MTQATTATNTPVSPTNTNGTTSDKTLKPAPTALEAVAKIGKILDQLSPTDRKRVLAFVNGETNE